MKKEARLGVREAFAMIVLMVGPKIADTTPAMLSQYGANAFWLFPLISFLTILPSVLILYYLLRRYNDKNLTELFEQILGKPIGKLIGFVFFSIFFLYTMLETRNYTEQIKLLYFPESPTVFIYFIFLTICFYGAKRGLEAIGSTAFIVLPYIKFSVLLLAALSLREVVWQRVFPIFGEGWGVLLTQGANKASIFADIMLLAMAFTSFRDKKSFQKGIFAGYIFVVFEMTFFFLIYCTMFDYNSVDKVAFLFHELTQFVDLGAFFTNIETFFLILWLLASFIKYMIYLYFISWIFGAVFNIKEFEPLILPFAFLSYMGGLLPENVVMSEQYYRDSFLTFTTPFFVLFPILLWIVAKLKGELAKQ